MNRVVAQLTSAHSGSYSSLANNSSGSSSPVAMMLRNSHPVSSGSLVSSPNSSGFSGTFAGSQITQTPSSTSAAPSFALTQASTTIPTGTLLIHYFLVRAFDCKIDEHFQVLHFYFTILGNGTTFGTSSFGSELSSMEPQMSSMFNDMVLPPSLKAFTTAFQPGSSAPFKTSSGLDNSLPPASFNFSNNFGFEMSSLTKTVDGHEDIMHSNRILQNQSNVPNNNINDIQQQNAIVREAGSGSSSPSAMSASSVRNSMHRTSSVDSQLALLRNEMVYKMCLFCFLLFRMVSCS